jgi:hypothetical protein
MKEYYEHSLINIIVTCSPDPGHIMLTNITCNIGITQRLNECSKKYIYFETQLGNFMWVNKDPKQSHISL